MSTKWFCSKCHKNYYEGDSHGGGSYLEERTKYNFECDNIIDYNADGTPIICKGREYDLTPLD